MAAPLKNVETFLKLEGNTTEVAVRRVHRDRLQIAKPLQQRRETLHNIQFSVEFAQDGFTPFALECQQPKYQTKIHLGIVSCATAKVKEAIGKIGSYDQQEPVDGCRDFGDTTDSDNTQESQDKVRSLSVEVTTETLRSRIDEQSSLIMILKQRADELLLRCQALKKANTELEGRVTDCQDELDVERQRADLLEKRFMDLAANNQAIIAFMNEYKNLNVQLKLENKELQSENDTLFSKKLQDKEVFVQKLMQDIKHLAEVYTKKENDDREKLSGYQSKLLEQAAEHQAKETSLLYQLHEAQQHQRHAEEKCQDLKLKIQKAEEQHALKDRGLRESLSSLTKEKDKLLLLSMERGKIIQEKQKEIQLLETKWREEKQARIEAEDRFEQEAEAVNLDVKVKSLQSALDDSVKKYGKFKKDFDAFKEHSTNLLIQERELNKKLRHMMG